MKKIFEIKRRNNKNMKKEKKDIIKELKNEIDSIEKILMPEDKALSKYEFGLLNVKAKRIIRILIDYIII